MHFTEISLRDFGDEVFQDARMQDIDDGLVIVGGPQRAGKTTFLQAVRRIGYGIEPGADLPPPADEYNIRATTRHEGHEYVIKLNGYAEPTIVSIGDAPDVSLTEVFGGLSKDQYRQLFTITLDELKRIPDTVEDAQDLSEVLLGAAYGDVAVIPKLQESFADQAYEIGRQYGKPTKRSELRGPMDTIEQGIELRDQANEQVDKWGQAQSELDELTEQISKLEARREELEYREERLSVLVDEFDTLREFQQLRATLETDDVESARAMPDSAPGRVETLVRTYDEAVGERDELRDQLSARAPRGDPNTYSSVLLDRQDDLVEFNRQVAKWEDQAEQIRTEAESISDRRAELKRRVQEMHADWSGEFEAVLEIDTGTLTADEIESASEQYDTAASDLEEATSKQTRLNDRLKRLREQLTEAEENQESEVDTRDMLVRAAGVGVVSLVITIGGAAASLLLVGGLLGTIVLLVGLYLVIGRAELRAEGTEPIREIKAEIASVEGDLEEVERDMDTLQTRRDAAADRLADVREELGLPDTVSGRGIESFYEQVVDLKTEIRELKHDEEAFERRRQSLVEELTAAADTLNDTGLFPQEIDESLEDVDTLLNAIETANADLEIARDFAKAEEQIAEIASDIEQLHAEWDAVDDVDLSDASEDKIRDTLNSLAERTGAAADTLSGVETRDRIEDRLEDKLQTGGTRRAFDSIRNDNESYLDALERIAESFDDVESVKEERRAVQEELEETTDKLDKSKDERVSLERDLEDLKSEEDIVKARNRITEGREELRKLGEEYAVNRIAEHITGRLHERFIEEVAGPLIDEASDIFYRITRAYDGIDHNQQFDDLDFDAIREGRAAHGTNELSRATTEQLFLAVRLARIRQLDVSLPVVIDDSMTNFDPSHGARTLRTLAELAETHQVFLLTCHPEQVMLSEQNGDIAQFWCLDGGRFTGPFSTSTEVYDLLSTDDGFLLEAE